MGCPLVEKGDLDFEERKSYNFRVVRENRNSVIANSGGGDYVFRIIDLSSHKFWFLQYME